MGIMYINYKKSLFDELYRLGAKLEQTESLSKEEIARVMHALEIQVYCIEDGPRRFTSKEENYKRLYEVLTS